MVNSILKMLVIGDVEDADPNSKAEEGRASTSLDTSEDPEISTYYYSMKLLLCIVGLQASYLTWGVLQVKF